MPGSSVPLTATVNPPGVYNYTWTGPYSYISSEQNPIISNIQFFQAGTYSVAVANSDKTCSAENDVSIVVSAAPPPITIAPITICQNKEPEPIAVNGYSFVWYTSPSDSVGSLIAPVPNTATLGTYYYYVAEYLNNCVSTISTIQVDVVVCCNGLVSIPNAFTPNNDGLNDFFMIVRSPNYVIDQFFIYDRWGNKVFSGNNEVDSWDGTYNGQPADLGVYFYMITLNCTQPGGTQIIKKGDITLIR